MLPFGWLSPACHVACSSVVILTAAYSVCFCRFHFSFAIQSLHPELVEGSAATHPPAARVFARLRVAAGYRLSCFCTIMRYTNAQAIAQTCPCEKAKNHTSPCVVPFHSTHSQPTPHSGLPVWHPCSTRRTARDACLLPITLKLHSQHPAVFWFSCVYPSGSNNKNKEFSEVRWAAQASRFRVVKVRPSVFEKISSTCWWKYFSKKP